jgi:hypothetical protein
MSAITLFVNYIPIVVNNWPKGFSGYICGTIPSNDAACAADSSLQNIGTDQPQTFEKCCSGRLVNITQPVTDSSNPSYGASCLAYCEVVFARTIDNGTGVGFGDYWNCLSNYTQDPFGGDTDTVIGQATCGWVNTSWHDQCEISVSVEQSYYSASPATALGNAISSAEPTASKTFASCPAAITPSTTSTPSATATGTKSGARHAKGETKMASVGTGLLMLGFSLLLFT